MKKGKDALGDRMKSYEAHESGRSFLRFLPIYARIDGRSFSKFTHGMDRPYDERLATALEETTRRLVAETGALIGYTQSDEISLVWCFDDPKQEPLFASKAQKLCSVLAALTTSIFIQECLAAGGEPAKRALTKTPHFDCRVFQMPNKEEAANCFLWREKDASKNAVSMAARAHFAHADLQGLSSAQMQEKMFQEKGVNFNDYPARFKRGVFLQRRLVEVKASNPKKPDEQGTTLRSRVVSLDMPIFGRVANRADVIFKGAEPLPIIELASSQNAA